MTQPAVVPTPRTRSTYHHGDLRRALIDASLALVTEGGVSALTLRAVAREAGVSQAAPYHHFTDRDALVAAVAEEGFGMLFSKLETVWEGRPANPRRAMQELAAGYVDFAVKHPAHYRLMFGHTLAERDPYPNLGNARRRLFELLSNAIVELQQRGLVRRGDPEELALAAWALIHGFSMLLVDGQMQGLITSAAQQQRVARELTALLVHGMVTSSTISPAMLAETSAKPAAAKRSFR